MNIMSKSIISGLLFLITIVVGIWLNRLGRPFPTSILTVHKVTALGAVIFAVLTVISIFKTSNIPPAILPIVIAGGIFILSLYVTGILLSIEKQTNGILLIVHCLSTVLTVISVIVCLLLRKN